MSEVNQAYSAWHAEKHPWDGTGDIGPSPMQQDLAKVNRIFQERVFPAMETLGQPFAVGEYEGLDCLYLSGVLVNPSNEMKYLAEAVQEVNEVSDKVYLRLEVGEKLSSCSNSKGVSGVWEERPHMDRNGALQGLNEWKERALGAVALDAKQREKVAAGVKRMDPCSKAPLYFEERAQIRDEVVDQWLNGSSDEEIVGAVVSRVRAEAEDSLAWLKELGEEKGEQLREEKLQEQEPRFEAAKESAKGWLKAIEETAAPDLKVKTDLIESVHEAMNRGVIGSIYKSGSTCRVTDLPVKMCQDYLDWLKDKAKRAEEAKKPKQEEAVENAEKPQKPKKAPITPAFRHFMDATSAIRKALKQTDLQISIGVHKDQERGVLFCRWTLED